jgi:hypothetical protein
VFDRVFRGLSSDRVATGLQEKYNLSTMLFRLTVEAAKRLSFLAG